MTRRGDRSGAGAVLALLLVLLSLLSLLELLDLIDVLDWDAFVKWLKSWTESKE